MAVNPNPPEPAAPAATPAAPVATPETDPTPAQVESRLVVKSLDAEIDDLWARAEGKTPASPSEPPVADTVTEATPPPATPEPVKAETPKTEDTPPPAPEIDRAAIEAEVRTRFEAEQAATRDAEERVRAEAAFRGQYEAYIGPSSEYDAVSAALRAAQRNDYTLLDALDVVLPNGKKVSQVKPDGAKGLTPQEAASLLDSWDTNRAYEDVMGTRKVQQVLTYWDQQTQAALADPDVDAKAVRTHRTPGDQMKTAIETTRATVTKRLTDAHAAELAARDKTIADQTERISSLVNERGNLTSQQRGARAATVERPGQPAGAPREIPRTAEEVRSMSTDEFFKTGLNDRLLQAIPGGAPRRRRTG